MRHRLLGNQKNDTTWMLFRQIDGPDDPVLFFNANMSELSGAELFDSEQALNKHLASHSVTGMPYTLEVGLKKATLKQMIDDGDYDSIAKAIKTMNSKDVRYDEGKFVYNQIRSELGKS